MPKSILRLSGAHWLRVMATWTGFFVLVGGIGESVSAGAEQATQTGVVSKELRPLTVEDTAGHETGRLTVEKIASFDFNRNAVRFGDVDADVSAKR